MSPATRVPVPGFGDPVRDAQHSFRAILDALARPARAVPVEAEPDGPAVLTPTGRAVLLTLADESTPVWLDPALDAVDDIAHWLGFHTGAVTVANPADAAFAVVGSPDALPDLALFAQGTDEAPHLSTTVLVIDAAGDHGEPYVADGPGFETAAHWVAPAFPEGFTRQWSENHARFPRGVDLVIAGPRHVTGLPRTTALAASETTASETTEG